ncbi:hypothetical protein [Leisingera sp. JC11]|uniref:hypothetical protein n=1 Tax=Leisingera sp. JC11 TaxID=3042469 RepID=UPI003455D68E
MLKPLKCRDAEGRCGYGDRRDVKKISRKSFWQLIKSTPLSDSKKFVIGVSSRVSNTTPIALVSGRRPPPRAASRTYDASSGAEQKSELNTDADIHAHVLGSLSARDLKRQEERRELTRRLDPR